MAGHYSYRWHKLRVFSQLWWYCLYRYLLYDLHNVFARQLFVTLLLVSYLEEPRFQAGLIPSVTVWKVSELGVFWSIFCSIWTEYGNLLLKSPYSVKKRENTDHKNSKFGHILRSVIVTLWQIITELWNCLIMFFNSLLIPISQVIYHLVDQLLPNMSKNQVTAMLPKFFAFDCWLRSKSLYNSSLLM